MPKKIRLQNGEQSVTFGPSGNGYRPEWFRLANRPMDEFASERAFYRSLRYLAYENPWDQMMLASYQGVEPIILSLYLGGGLVEAEDDRILALVPQAATYDEDIVRKFTVHLWNPTAEPIETRLRARIAEKRRETWMCSGKISGRVTADSPSTRPVEVPPREALRLTFKK